MSERENQFCYGDKVDVLRRPAADESVDLACLDSPVSSNAPYKVPFAEQDGAKASAQIRAFQSISQWVHEAARQHEETLGVTRKPR